jgi:hypothetical protein
MIMKRAILFAAVSLLSSGVAVCIPQAAPVPVPSPNGQMLVQPQANLIEDTNAKGAPFTAEYVLENKGTLRDGTEVNVKRTMMRYRDGEGRTRIETEDMITIVDPVAHVNYTLNKKSLTGTKGPRTPTAAELQLRQEAQAALDAQNRAAAASKSPSVTLGREVTTESLGIQVMEGVTVQGERTTMMMRFGMMEDAPMIKVVGERWYSPELKLSILTKSDDPRQATVTVSKYTNIVLGEPDPALFRPPSGYAVRDLNQRQEEIQ